jgi:hypothetical protein
MRFRNRTAALTTGILFIAATAANLVATAIETRYAAAGVLLELVAAGTSAGIAISLYPVLRAWGTRIALGSVAFRSIEAAMYSVGAVCLLSSGLVDLRRASILAGVFAFCAGALMYYFLFYRSGLIPRWLSGWGLLATVLLLVACLSALFSGNAVQTYTVLIVPIAVQEMVLAVWLIVRGFDHPTPPKSQPASVTNPA